MIEVKQSQRAWVPVRLFDASSGSGSQGAVYSNVSVLIVKGDTSEASYNVGVAGDWVEHATAPASSAGLYQLNLLASDTDKAGSLIYVVQSTTSRPFIGSINVVAVQEADTYARIGSPVLSTIALDIAAVSTGPLSASIVTLSSSLRNETLSGVSTVSGSIVNLSSSLRSEILTAKDLLSGSIALTSASLRTEINSGGGFTVISGSIVALSSSLRSEINSGGGFNILSSSLNIISGTINALSSTLRTEIITNRSVLSGSIVNTSASLRSEIIANGGAAGTTILSASIVTLSSSLRSEILSNRSILSSSIVNTSASLGYQATSNYNNLGGFIYALSASLVNVSSSLWIEIADAAASVSSSLGQQILATSASLGQQLTRARAVNEGSWKIFTTGPDMNKMVFYDLAGAVLFKQALSGSTGTPTTNSPFERNPTS